MWTAPFTIYGLFTIPFTVRHCTGYNWLCTIYPRHATVQDTTGCAPYTLRSPLYHKVDSVIESSLWEIIGRKSFALINLSLNFCETTIYDNKVFLENLTTPYKLWCGLSWLLSVKLTLLAELTFVGWADFCWLCWLLLAELPIVGSADFYWLSWWYWLTTVDGDRI